MDFKYKDETIEGRNKEELKALLEEFVDGLAEARKKQEEHDSMDDSWIKLADNVLIKFKFPDEGRIVQAILEQKRKLGFLLDDEEEKMRETMTPFQLESLAETREKITNGIEYSCTYRKESGTTSSIGTPNMKAMAKFISEFSQKRGLSSLCPETHIGLFQINRNP